MAYIKQKNSDVIVCDENGTPIQGTSAELSVHPAITSGLHEIVDQNLPTALENKLFFTISN